MKTAIPIPNGVFSSAERFAKRLKISRSELYGRALDEYLACHAPDAVTDALDKICVDLNGSQESEFSSLASRRILEQTEW